MANQEQKVYWGRAGYVAIEDRSGKMIKFGGSEDSLDFKFSGEKIGDINPKFSVGILGLSVEHINQLAVWDINVAASKPRRIQVFAGYSHDSLANPLFDGYVINAIPTSPPEMWLNFECLYSLGDIRPIEVQYEKKGTLEEIAREIAGNMKMPFKWSAETVDKEKEAKFVFSGSKTDSVAKFASAFGVIVYNNNGVMTVTDNRGWYGDVKNAEVVSTESGMLGIGSVDMRGAIIRKRLDNTSGIFSWVKLQSSLIPSANGDYFVIKAKHVGHFRGEEWYTELETIRHKR